MHNQSLEPWQHEHTFGQERRRMGEQRTRVVIALTAATMALEIIAGSAFGSMALLADGLHMASHTVALGIAAIAYYYARRQARNRRFSFGTGKINSLAGFSGALLLAVFAVIMGWESVERFINPVSIVFDSAILVAVIGLAVNGISAWILGDFRGRDPAGQSHAHHHDHNLRSAFLHVLADALTSGLAIGALLAGKFWGAVWMDPAMGIVGMLLVSRWSYGLLKETTRVLLDQEAPDHVRAGIRDAIEAHEDNRVADLHVWSIGPGLFTAIISVVTHKPRSAEHYKRMIPERLAIVHPIIEVHKCPGSDGEHESSSEATLIVQ